jgi:hypothetical protein
MTREEWLALSDERDMWMQRALDAERDGYRRGYADGHRDGIEGEWARRRKLPGIVVTGLSQAELRRRRAQPGPARVPFGGWGPGYSAPPYPSSMMARHAARTAGRHG